MAGEYRVMRAICDFADEWELQFGSAATKPYQFAIAFGRDVQNKAAAEIHQLQTERDTLRVALDAVVRCAMDAESENCLICDSENDYEHRHTEDCPILEAERLLAGDGHNGK